MTSVPEAAGPMPAAASTSSGRPLSLSGWSTTPQGSQFERDAILARACDTDAVRQLQRCFARWATALEHLSWRSLRALADNRPVTPTTPTRGAPATRPRSACCAATASPAPTPDTSP